MNFSVVFFYFIFKKYSTWDAVSLHEEACNKNEAMFILIYFIFAFINFV